jgi:hypothetical protein
MSTLTSPTYLFEFISDVTGGSYTCIAADASSYPARYNEFVITENDSPTPLSGEVTLDLAGLYTFKVYEQTSTTNLQPALADNELDAGKCRVEINGDRESTTYTTYNNSETVSVFDNFANEGIVVNPPTTVYENSDQSYQVTIPDGTTHVAPDITWTDSDGSTNTAPANTNITCTPSGTPASGILYQRPIIPGWRTSFSLYDEGWQLTNGTYDYTKTNPATVARLDNSATFPFHTLDANNAFGNVYRFTDENGDHYTDPFDSGTKSDAGAFSTDYVIDHLTGLGWKRNYTAGGGNPWATLLSNANSATHATFSDWRMANIKELFSILCWDIDSTAPGTRYTGGEYWPWNMENVREYFTSTTQKADTSRSATYFSGVNSFFSINLNNEPKANTLSYWICRNHYT